MLFCIVVLSTSFILSENFPHFFIACKSLHDAKFFSSFFTICTVIAD